MEIVNTTSAGHAKSLASTVDFSTCPDGMTTSLYGCLREEEEKERFFFFFLSCQVTPSGLTLLRFCLVCAGIICVGGDGIVNEVCHSSHLES